MAGNVRASVARAARWASVYSLALVAVALSFGVGAFVLLGGSAGASPLADEETLARTADDAELWRSRWIPLAYAEEWGLAPGAQAAAEDGPFSTWNSNDRMLLARLEALIQRPPLELEPMVADMQRGARRLSLPVYRTAPEPQPSAVAPEVGVSGQVVELTVAAPLEPGDRVRAPVTFYYCERGTGGYPVGDGGGWCGHMRNGNIVHPGAAACAVDYLGQRFRIEGDPLNRVYECEDTGSAVHGQHRDIWFHNSDDGWRWANQVGHEATLIILE